MKSSNLVAIVLACLLVSSTLADINSEFASAVENMIGGQIDTAFLLGRMTTAAAFSSKDDRTGNVDVLADSPVELVVDSGDLKITTKVYPYKRIRSLKYGKNVGLKSLTFNNNINTQTATVTASGLVAVKREKDGKIELRYATGTATAPVKKKFNKTEYKKCKFGEKFKIECWNETMLVERGLFTGEVETILSKLQREAAIAMRDEIKKSLSAAVIQPMRTLSSLYLDESTGLRSLYRQLEYDQSTFTNIPLEDLPKMIDTATLGSVGRVEVVNRMLSIARGSPRSCHLNAPSDGNLVVLCFKNAETTVNMDVISAKVDGKLPVGAYAYSTGSWVVENMGQGSSPSLREILALFPPLRQ